MPVPKGNLERLSPGPGISMAAGTDVAGSAEIDFTTEKRFQSLIYYKWVSVEMHDGNGMVSVARGTLTLGVVDAAPTANVFHQRAYSGQPRFFPIPYGVLPDVKIKAVSGTVNGSVFFHK